MNGANCWIKVMGLVALFAFTQSVWAATCSSNGTGRWDRAATWICTGGVTVPGKNDNVIINSPDVVTLRANSFATSLTINTGATLNDNGNTLTVSGNVINNGSFGVVGGGGRLTMTGAGTTISGTGTFADSRLYIDANVTLPATSTMNFTAGGQIRVGKNAAGTFTIAGTITDVGATAGNRILRVYNGSTVSINGSLNTPSSYAEIQAGGAVVNNGTATLQYLMGGNATTSIWTNAANSTLNVSGAVCATACMLNASAAGNTVNFNGAAQTVYVPSGSTYANLTLSGSGAVTVPTGLTVAGNFTMSGSATVAAPAALAVGGDFIIGAGSTFTPGTGTVTLSGAGVQTIGGGTTNLSFNNLTVSNTAGITLTRNVVVTGTLTGTVVLTPTCPADFTLTVGATVTHSCPPATVANFDCVETGLAYTPNPVAPARNPLYTKLAGTAFSFDVVALKADGTVETNFAKSITVELVDTSVAGACASYPALATAVSQTLTLVAANKGRKATANMTVANSYPSLGCRVTDKTVTPNIVGCSVDKFSVRPVSLALTAAGLNADATGASTTAAPVVKAGANFMLTATASDAGYTGTPTLDNVQLVAHAGAVRNGSLAGAFGAAVAGTASGAAFTYDDVGYFKLNANGLLDATFTATDSAAGDCTPDFSTTLTGGKYGCNVGSAAAGYFGRFIPDHFAITPGAVTSANNGFTYLGQDGFSTAFTLTAQNTSNVTTQNYSGTFAALGLTTWSNFAFTAAGLPAGAALSASASVPSGTWSKGATTALTAKHQVNRPANPAAVSQVTVSAKPVDADGVTLPAAAAVNAAATALYYGQIKLANSIGSELIPMTVTATVQYCGAVIGSTCSSWQTNAPDTLTALSAPYLNVGNPNPAGFAVSVGVPAAISNGQINIRLSSTAKAKGSVDVTAQGPAWLPNSGTARATFGIYKGSKDLIYLRESY